AGVPAGTYAMILVPVASGTWTLLAGWPLNDTIGMARSWLSQEPVIVTLVPTLPWLGPNDAIRGAFVDRASAEPVRRQAVPTRSATIDTNVICFRISITPFVRFLAIRPTRVPKRRKLNRPDRSTTVRRDGRTRGSASSRVRRREARRGSSRGR